MARKPKQSLTATDGPRKGDERQRAILEMMASGTWVPGASNVQMERRYGVAPATIKKDTEIASKMLRFYAGETEDIRTLFAANIAAIRRYAMASVRIEKKWNRKTEKWDTLEIPTPDLGTALKSIELQARLLGLTPNRIEIVTSDAGEIDDWNEEQLEYYLRTHRVPDELRESMTEKQIEAFEKFDGQTITTEGTVTE